jgi:hypothetical protein
MKKSFLGLLVFGAGLASSSHATQGRFDVGATIEVKRPPASPILPTLLVANQGKTQCYFYSPSGTRQQVSVGDKFTVKAEATATLGIVETSLTTADIYVDYHGAGDLNALQSPEILARELAREGKTQWKKCKRLSSNKRTCAASTNQIVLQYFQVATYSLQDARGENIALACGSPYRFSQWFPVDGYSLPTKAELADALAEVKP